MDQADKNEVRGGGKEPLASEFLGTLALEVLNRLRLGIILADELGHVRYANPAGREVLNRGEGLCLQNGRLFAQQRAETPSLRNALVAACRGQDEALHSCALCLTRDSGERAMPLLLMPVGGSKSGLAALLLGEPDRYRHLTQGQLQDMFGFSQAEALLVLALLAGLSIEDHADARGIKRATVRTQLLSIFRKTQTRKQAELALLMAAIPPVSTETPNK
jgi:DNA-binding CsgD family transcriptional regulator